VDGEDGAKDSCRLAFTFALLLPSADGVPKPGMILLLI
jgi:hypothetical protein